MATTNVSLTAGVWAELATGPTSTPLTVASRARVFEIAIAATTPVINGFKVNPGSPYNVTLDPGEKLYAKSTNFNIQLILNT
jgi:hypothetical protein